MHVSDLTMHDAVEGTAGGLPSIVFALLREVLRAVECMRPVFGRANTVLDPSDHGATSRRPFIRLAGPLVVAVRHLVEHSRADSPIEVSGRQQVIDDASQGESRASPLIPLIENIGDEITVHQDVGQRTETRLIEPISEVDAIRLGVEFAPDFLLGRNGGFRLSSAGGLGTSCLGGGIVTGTWFLPGHHRASERATLARATRELIPALRRGARRGLIYRTSPTTTRVSMRVPRPRNRNQPPMDRTSSPLADRQDHRSGSETRDWNTKSTKSTKKPRYRENQTRVTQQLPVRVDGHSGSGGLVPTTDSDPPRKHSWGLADGLRHRPQPPRCSSTKPG